MTNIEEKAFNNILQLWKNFYLKQNKMNRRKLILISFSLGFVVNSILLLSNIIEKKKKAEIDQIRKEAFKNKLILKCQEETKYNTFIDLGFIETAKNKLKICLQENY